MKRVAEMLRHVVEGSVKENEPMTRHTSVRIGGAAEIYVEPANLDDVVAVQRIAQETNTPLRVIGKGSNVLVADSGVQGIVVSFGRQFADISFSGQTAIVQSGALFPRFAKLAADRGLTGIEFAGGIPGTVGGAIVMNAGAHGGEVADTCRSVTVIEGDGTLRTYEADELQFSYRRSRFSGQHDVIVVGGTFHFARDDEQNIKERMRSYAKRRRVTQPLGAPSSGSVFKNPPGDYAGRLIETAGLKGTRRGQAMISEAHGNFIVNCGGATARDVLQLIEHVRERILAKFSIELHLEVELIGM